MDLKNMQWKGSGSFKEVNSVKSTYDSRAYAAFREDEDRRKAQLFQMQEIQNGINAGKLNEDGSEKNGNLFSTVGDFVGSFAKSMVEGVSTLGKAGGDILGEVTGQNQAMRSDRERTHQENLDGLGIASKALQREDLTDEQRKSYTELKRLYEKRIEDSTHEFESDVKEKNDRAERLPAAIAEVGLDIITAGAIGTAVRGAKTAKGVGKALNVANTSKAAQAINNLADTSKVVAGANKVLNPTGIKQMIGSGAALGTAYGLTGTSLELGADAGIGDFAQGAAIGAGAGAVLGPVLTGVFKGVSKSIAGIQNKSKNVEGSVKKIVDNLTEEELSVPGAVDKINELAAESKTVGEFKNKIDNFLMEAESASGDVAQTTTSTASRSTADIEAEMQSIQNLDESEFVRYSTDKGTDVTDEVAPIYAAMDRQRRELSDRVQQLELQAANGGDGADAARDAAMGIREQIADMDAKLDQALVNSGYGSVTKSIDNAAMTARFRELNKELSSAKIKEGATNAQAELRNINAGEIPEEFATKPLPATTADEAVQRASRLDTSDTLNIQEAYAANSSLRADINRQLSELITPEKSAELKNMYREDYDNAIAALEGEPAPIVKLRTEELDMDYMENIAWLDRQSSTDQLRAAELRDGLKIADDVDSNILNEWNSMEQSNADVFSEIDTEGLAKYVDDLNAQVKRAEDLSGAKGAATQGDAVVDELSSARTPGGVQRKLESNPELAEASSDNIADMTVGDTDVNWVTKAISEPKAWLSRWGTTGEELLNIWTKSLNERDRFRGSMEVRSRNNKWSTATKGKYMEQTADFLNDGKPMKIGEGESVAKFKVRKAAAEDIKLMLQEVGRMQGLPEDMVLKNYFPHIVERNTGLRVDDIAKKMEMLRAGKDANGKPLSTSEKNKLSSEILGVDAETRQFIASKGLYNYESGFLKKRTGAENWSRDVGEVLSTYLRSAEKEIFIKEALKDSQPYANRLERDQLDLYEQWIGQLQHGHGKGALSLPIKGTNKSVADVLSAARRMQNVALMGASIRTTLLQIDSVKNILVESKSLGSFMQSGYKAMAMYGNGGKQLRDEIRAMGVLESGFGTSLTRAATTGQKFSKVERTLMSNISAVDNHARSWAYIDGKESMLRQLSKDKGVPVDKLSADDIATAREYGVKKAKDAMFDLSELGMPVLQNTDLGKTFTQIQQFNLKMTKYNVDILKGVAKGEKGSVRRLVSAIAGYGVLMTFMTTAGQEIQDATGLQTNVLGLDWEDMLPFGEQISSGFEALVTMNPDKFEMPSIPLLSMFTGSEKGKGVKDYIKQIGRYREGDITLEELQSELSEAPWFLVRNLLPAGTQLNRTRQGIELALSGEMTNKAGNTRFIQENRSAFNIMKGILGGPYATDEGQKWLRDGMQTISSNSKVEMPDGSKVKVSDYIRRLEPSEQANWIKYYQTKQNAQKQLKKGGYDRDDTVKNIRAGLQSGSLTYEQAAREASNYNNTVLQLYAPYLQGNQGIPARLSDDLMTKVLIDVSTISSRAPSISSERSSRLSDYYDEESSYFQ